MTNDQKEMHKQIKRLEILTVIVSVIFAAIVLITAHYFTNG